MAVAGGIRNVLERETELPVVARRNGQQIEPVEVEEAVAIGDQKRLVEPVADVGEGTGGAGRFGLGDHGHAHAPPRQIRGGRRARAPALLHDVGPEPREQDDVGEAVAGRGVDEIGDEGAACDGQTGLGHGLGHAAESRAPAADEENRLSQQTASSTKPHR